MDILTVNIEKAEDFNEDRQVIKIKCEDEQELLATKEMAIEIHALAGRLYQIFDGNYERMDGDTEFLEDAWNVFRDLWDSGFQICVNGSKNIDERIGSRKQTNIAPIRSITNVHDETVCSIKYRSEDGALCEVTSNGGAEAFYKALKQVIPEKDYSYMEAMQKKNAYAGSKEKSVEERIIELKNLLDKELITEDEYTKKREELLNEI